MIIEQSYIFKRIEVLYILLLQDKYEHPLDLAKDLQEITNEAWSQVEELYQSCIRIP